MFTGRSNELFQLVQCLDAPRNSGGRAMCLTGEAGIGKSTLLAEIREIARNRGYTIAATISHEDDWQPPYAPWLSILEHLGQSASGLRPDTAELPAGEHRFRMQAAVLDGLHKAYFDDGENLEDVVVLVRIAKDAGFDPDALQDLGEALMNDVRRDDVLAMIGQAQTAGISGVPFFIFDGKLSLSGAQPPEVILRALTKAADLQETVTS